MMSAVAVAALAVVPPQITANPAVVRTGPVSAVVTGTYQCSGPGAGISVALLTTAPSGTVVAAQGGGGFPCTGLPAAWAVTVRGTIHPGPGTVHAVISQSVPAATASFDGPVVVA